MVSVEARNLAKRYGAGEAAVLAVRDVSLAVAPGEFIAVMGESGSGKSTLLSLLGALAAPTAGSYVVDGIDVVALDVDQRAEFRRQYVGFVFQSFHLVPYLSVAENVMLPLAAAPLPPGGKRRMAEAALARVGLAGKGHRLPAEISGGEAERAAIARAIVNDPPLLLADEPTGNLDSRTSRVVMEMLGELNRGGMTIVMVTHSPQCAAHAARVIRVCDGTIVADAPAGQALAGTTA